MKQVPELQSVRSLEGGRMVRGVEDVLNELDENAVEAAVALAERLGGTVTALTMGPEDSDDTLRRALQMGADDGVHVLDDALAGADVGVTARALAAAVRFLAADAPVDLVVTGMATMDSLTSMLPDALAVTLGLPALTLAAAVECDGAILRITRTIGESTEVLSAPLPALLSVTDQANEPRIPNFAAMKAARRRPIRTVALSDLGLVGVEPATAVLSAAPRPGRARGTIVRDTGDGGTLLAGFLRENRLV